MSAPMTASGEAPISMAEVRDWLRLGPSDSDAHVAGLIRAATNLCEAFTGQMLVVREVSEDWIADNVWRTLARQPVAAIDDVTRLDGASGPLILPSTTWETRWLAHGAAAVRLVPAHSGQRVRIRYRAGLAQSPGGVPEAVRQGIMRLVQHWHFSSEPADSRLPAIVTALWSPWRRVSLGSGQ